MSRHYSERTAAGLTPWPSIDDNYIDEFGRIEPQVHEEAGVLWHQAERYALTMLRDEAKGQRMMCKAAALVSKVHAEPKSRIENLRAYLFQTFKHLVLAEIEKENRRRLRAAEMGESLRRRTASNIIDEVNAKILIEQIAQRMDPWTCSVFKLLVQGHTFTEIGEEFGTSSHLIRTRFNKRINKIMQKVREETCAAEQKNSAAHPGHLSKKT